MPTGFNLGTAYATIKIDSSGIASGMDKAKKSVSSGIKDMSQGFKNVGMAISAVSAPIVAFGINAVKAFSDSQKVTAQLDAVLKSTGQTAGVTRDMALDLAAGFQQVTMFEDEAILSGENMLLTFTNIGKDVFPTATQTMLDMSTALGQDLTQSAMQLGKALNDPIQGVTALRRVGVQLTDEQEALVKSFMDVGDVASAQKIILQELQREFGGSAEAAGKTFAGQLAILQNQLGEVSESVGKVLVPVLSSLVTTYIMPIVNKIVEWVDKNPELVLQIAALAVGGVALGAALYVVGAVLPAIVSGVGLLLSPVVLLAAAFAALVYAAATLYPGGIAQLLTDAATAAKTLVDIGLLILVDTLNKAAASATVLVAVVQFMLISTLNAASVAAQQLIAIVVDWIEKNRTLVTLLENLVIAIAIVKGGVIAYNAVLTIVSTLTAATATGTGALTAALALMTSPIVIATAAVWALVTAFRALAEARGQAQAAAQAVAPDLANAIQGTGTTLQQTLDAAFRATVEEYINQGLPPALADAKARLIWGSGIINMQGAVTDAYNAAQSMNNGGGQAYGGNVLAGMKYTVGERGAETFVPQVNGSIVPAGAGGGGMVVNVQGIYANTEAGGRAAARGFAEELEDLFRGRGNQ